MIGYLSRGAKSVLAIHSSFYQLWWYNNCLEGNRRVRR